MPGGGEIARDHRQRAGLTLEEVAERLRVSPAAVAHWERGRFHPRRANAVKLDELVGANGAVLAGFGYAVDVTPQGADDDVPYDELRSLVRALGAAVERLEARIDELEHRFDAPAPTSEPGSNAARSQARSVRTRP